MATALAQDCHDDDIWCRIAACDNLPSPPGIAAQLINLAQSHDTDFEQVEQLVKLDPIIATKLLRLANSSFYARDRKIENLRQAIGQFGLNGTLIIALTFSLVKVPKDRPGLDHNRFWLRSLAAAIICKRLAQLCCAGAQESFYLAGLLQDIGILVLDSVQPELYNGLSDDAAGHQALINAEEQATRINHSDVGAWLLEQWQFPQLYVDATKTSHSLTQCSSKAEIPLLSKCVAISSHLADLWIMPLVDLPNELGPIVTDQLELDDDAIHTLLSDAGAEILEVAELFDLSLMDETMADTLLSQAKEALTLRSLLTEQTLKQTVAQVTDLEQRTANLERKLDYDELTGMHSRAYAYSVLEKQFPQSIPRGCPISLVFVDLDNFKRINDQYGHSVGDNVLKLAAKTLKKATRTGDVVARMGGEEFVIILFDTGFVNASAICDHLVELFSTTSLDIDDNAAVSVTASAGLSVHGEEVHYKDIHCLIDSADIACYRAKTSGKNRWIYTKA